MQGPSSFVVLEAQQIIISTNGVAGNGLFVYNPAPGSGNLVDSIVAVAGPDRFGNNTVPGFASYSGTNTAQLTGASLKFFVILATRIQLDANGLKQFNNSGALIYSVDTSGDATYLYTDTGSATQGALIASQASASGSDSFSNPHPAGVTSYVVIAGSFPGTYAITLTDQANIYGNTVASLIFNNQTHAPNVPPAVTAQTHSTAGSNLNLQSGKTLAGSQSAELQVQDSVSSSRNGGLVDIFSGALQVTLPDGNTYRTERFTNVLPVDFSVTSALQTAIISVNIENGVQYRFRGLVRGVMGGTASTVGYQFNPAGGGAISAIYVGGILSAGGTFPGTTESEFNFLTATLTDFPSPTFTAGFSYQFWFEGIFTCSATGSFNISDRATGFSHTIKALSYLELLPVT